MLARHVFLGLAGASLVGAGSAWAVENRRSYCGQSFAISLAPGESITAQKTDGRWFYKARIKEGVLALGEKEHSLPPETTRTVVSKSDELVVVQVNRGRRTIGYLVEDARQGTKTMILARALRGYPQDRTFLRGFDFSPSRKCTVIKANK